MATGAGAEPAAPAAVALETRTELEGRESPEQDLTYGPFDSRPSPDSVRSPGRGLAAAEAKGPQPRPESSGDEGTTCPVRAGAGGAGQAQLPEPERTAAAPPGFVRPRRWASGARTSRARVDASSWTARWGTSGRERVRASALAGSAGSAHRRGRATETLWSNERRDGPEAGEEEVGKGWGR